MNACAKTTHFVQFPGEESYDTVQPKLAAMTREEVVSMLKRNSTGFSRGRSRYRGVTSALSKAAQPMSTWEPKQCLCFDRQWLCSTGHHQQGKFEARIGRVAGSRYLYLGTFSTEKEAAEA